MNLSYIATITSIWTVGHRYGCLCHGPSIAPVPLEHADNYSKQIFDENVDEPAAHIDVAAYQMGEICERAR